MKCSCNIDPGVWYGGISMCYIHECLAELDDGVSPQQKQADAKGGAVNGESE